MSTVWYDLEAVYNAWLNQGFKTRTESYTSWKVRTIKSFSHGLREINVPSPGRGRPPRVMVVTRETALQILGRDEFKAPPAEIPYRLTDLARPLQMAPGIFKLPGRQDVMSRDELIKYAAVHDSSLIEPDFLPL